MARDRLFGVFKDTVRSNDEQGSVPGIIGRMLQLSALAGVVLAAILIPVTTFVAFTANKITTDIVDLPLKLEDKATPQTSRLVAADGELIAYFYQENRQDVPLEEISPNMQKALITIEDARFYEHGALDLKGTLRALINNASSGDTQGGSSITQQLIKLTLVQQATTKEQVAAATEVSTARKIRELKLAIAYEQEHTKEQILERYLNIAYFGDGSYGVSAAAYHFFSRSPDKLNVKQAATLAGLVKNPVQFDPETYPEKALQRRNTVLAVMAREGVITQKKADRLAAQGLGLKFTRFPNGCLGTSAEFSCDYIRQYLLSDKSLGETVAERREMLERGGLTIKSNIDLRMQEAINDAVDSNVDATDQAIGAIALVEPGTGKVRGVAQSRHMGKKKAQGESYLNFSVPTKYGQSLGFQAGSTFKMFTVAAALKEDIDVSQTYDSPPTLTVPAGTYFDCEGGGTGTWAVKNSTTSGKKNMYTGTRESVNTYFAQLEEEVGLCDTVKTAESMGIRVPFDPKKNITDVVGPFTLGVTAVSPLDMAAAYAVPASGGLYCKPRPIAQIVDRYGKSIKKYKDSCKRVLTEGQAAQINDILAGLQRPGGFGYARGTGLNIPSAAKTGTTNENKSVWYVGYTPEMSAASMIAGADKNGKQIPLAGSVVNGRVVGFSEAAGSALAGPMWKAAMGVIQNYLAPVNFDRPPKGPPAPPKPDKPKKKKGGDDEDG